MIYKDGSCEGPRKFDQEFHEEALRIVRETGKPVAVVA
jgi:hypothetical protein